MEMESLDILFDDLAHPNPYIQSQAFMAMVRDWPQQALPRLLGLLAQPDIALRRASVRGIGAFGAAALLPLADLLMASTDSTIRASCVKAYAQVASNQPGIHFPETAMRALEEALSDDSPVVAVASVMALGQVGGQAVPLLLRVVGGDNPAQAVAAVNALAQIDDPAIEPILKDLQHQPQVDSYVRETLESALARISDLQARQPQPGRRETISILTCSAD
jgi:bilin biosynthesis protein